MVEDANSDDVTLSMPEEVNSVTQSLEVAQDTMAKFVDTASVDRVFGRPIRRGETTIIPAAEVVAGLGFGIGFGSGTSNDSDDEEGPSSGEGGGGGGGGKILARPVAVIVVTPEGVEVRHVHDRTKVLLAAITAVGFMLATLAGFLNPKEAAKYLKGS